jgi:hypothetical protein
MPAYQFRVGQKVQLVATFERYTRGGDYEIVRQLPAVKGEFYYRIKGVHEPHDRVVRESELKPA